MDLRFHEVSLPVKTKVKKALNTLDFSVSLVIRSPALISSGLTFSLVVFLLLLCFINVDCHTPTGIFLVVFILAVYPWYSILWQSKGLACFGALRKQRQWAQCQQCCYKQRRAVLWVVQNPAQSEEYCSEALKPVLLSQLSRSNHVNIWLSLGLTHYDRQIGEGVGNDCLKWCN